MKVALLLRRAINKLTPITRKQPQGQGPTPKQAEQTLILKKKAFEKAKRELADAAVVFEQKNPKPNLIPNGEKAHRFWQENKPWEWAEDAVKAVPQKMRDLVCPRVMSMDKVKAAIKTAALPADFIEKNATQSTTYSLVVRV